MTGLHDSISPYLIHLLFCFLALYSFALMSISLRDFPLLKDIIGGSLNISFNKGWFCIKFQGFIRIPFKLRTDGWYCVTNGKILLFAFILGLRANCLSVKITSEIDFPFLLQSLSRLYSVGGIKLVFIYPNGRRFISRAIVLLRTRIFWKRNQIVSLL